MGWSIGFDSNWNRDIGYGVPAECDLPTCHKEIDRGLACVCGSDPYGGEYGCGLYFCEDHFNYRTPHGLDRMIQLCPRCYRYREAFKPKPDIKKWINHKMTDPSWAKWRQQNLNDKP